MMSQLGKQTIAIHKLISISRSKGIQRVNFGQLINITWETFFLKIYTQNVVEKLFPDPFLKNQNGQFLWINSLKFYTVCFYCMPR